MLPSFCFDANANRIWNGVRCFKEAHRCLTKINFCMRVNHMEIFKFLRFRMTVDT